MSLVKTLQEIETERNQLKETLTAKETELTAVQAQVDELSKGVDSVKADYEKKLTDIQTASEALKTENAKLVKQITKANADIENYKKTMANPAFVDAKTEGTEPVKAGEVKTDETGDVNKQYQAIKDPMERATFWRKHILSK